MNTQQKLLNDINRKIGYTGEDLSLQSASNWLAENVHLINGSTGGGGIASPLILPERYIHWHSLMAKFSTDDNKFFAPYPTPLNGIWNQTLNEIVGFVYDDNNKTIVYEGEEKCWFVLDVTMVVTMYPNTGATGKDVVGMEIKWKDVSENREYSLARGVNVDVKNFTQTYTLNDKILLEKGDTLKIGYYTNLAMNKFQKPYFDSVTVHLTPDILLNSIEQFGSSEKRSVTMQPKAPYVGDFMTTQTALNYIAENIGTGGGGTGGAVTADDIMRIADLLGNVKPMKVSNKIRWNFDGDNPEDSTLTKLYGKKSDRKWHEIPQINATNILPHISSEGNVKPTKVGEKIKLVADEDKPTGTGLFGKKEDGTWEVIRSSGESGNVEDFRLDENDPFGIKLVYTDGTEKKINLLGMHREFPKGHAFQFQDVLKYTFPEAKWSHITQLNKDYIIPLGTFKEKYYKGGIRFNIEGDKHILHFPEGNLTVKSKLDIEATWKKWPEVSEEPYNKGVYTRTMKAFLRRQGSTTWELAGSKSYSWNEEYGKYMPCGVNVRGVELSFVLPDVPCDVYFTYCFDRFGDNPWEFLSMPLYFGVRDIDNSPGTLPAGTGFFITTTKVINDDWIPHP